MPSLIAAILILGLAWYGLKFFSRASPASVAQMMRYGGGALAGVVGLVLLLRGRPDLGIGAMGAGLWLAGFSKVPGKAAFWNWRKASTGRSGVRSAMLEMRLDHSTGAMYGRIIAGPHTGRTLETMTRSECEDLYRVCLNDDPEGARLLEAYMDRRFPGWGQAGQSQSNTRSADRQGRSRAGVSEEEAYEILGLRKGATRDDIVRAHRTLMKKLHPDHGGTTSLAARVNEAKEVLLRSVE